MGKNKKQSEKRRRKTGSSGDELNESKLFKHGGPGRGQSDSSNISDTESSSKIATVEVSKIINETNCILFDESAVFQETELDNKENKENRHNKSKMASSVCNNDKSQNEIIAYLKRIEDRIGNVEAKLSALDKLEKRVEKFDNDMQKMWLHIDSINKKTGDKLIKLDERMDNAELQDGKQQSVLQQLEKENATLKESIAYIQSQTMRNNLIFCNIPEIANEKPMETEGIIREFIVNKLKIAQDEVDKIKIERAHRMGHIGGHQGHQGRPRKIVVKFSYFKDRENIRQNGKNLKGTNFYIHEQFPPEVVSKRKSLMPHMKKARQENKRAWISYDTLYVDGRPVKID